MLCAALDASAPHAVGFFVDPSGYYLDELERHFPGLARRKVKGFGPCEVVAVQHDALPALTYCSYHPHYLWRTRKRGNVERTARLIAQDLQAR